MALFPYCLGCCFQHYNYFVATHDEASQSICATSWWKIILCQTPIPAPSNARPTSHPSESEPAYICRMYFPSTSPPFSDTYFCKSSVIRALYTTSYNEKPQFSRLSNKVSPVRWNTDEGQYSELQSSENFIIPLRPGATE